MRRSENVSLWRSLWSRTIEVMQVSCFGEPGTMLLGTGDRFLIVHPLKASVPQQLALQHQVFIQGHIAGSIVKKRPSDRRAGSRRHLPTVL